MKALFSITLIFFAIVYSYAQSAVYYSQNGIAVKGYDVVAYFTEHAAVEGIKQFSYSWDGVEWHFKNQEDLNAFKANPQKYVPQFGGYCAYGVSINRKAPIDPTAFTIVDGKLYLNYDVDVKKKWMKDEQNNIKKAQANWPMLKDKN